MANSDNGVIAYGSGTILELWLRNEPDTKIQFAVDNSVNHSDFVNPYDFEVIPPNELVKKHNSLCRGIPIVVTAISSRAQQEIFNYLVERNYVFGRDFFDIATWLCEKKALLKEVSQFLGREPDTHRFLSARAYNYTTGIRTDTTIAGNYLLSELIATTQQNRSTSILEVGVFRGGNAFFQLQNMLSLRDERKYYMLDSFSGFREINNHDPAHLKGLYDDLHRRLSTENVAKLFPNANLICGYAPEAFSNINQDEMFSLVFYDCDLYQPAVDTIERFWPAIVPGGFMVFHDYCAAENKWTGVKAAVDAFSSEYDITVNVFWPATMAIVKKE